MGKKQDYYLCFNYFSSRDCDYTYFFTTEKEILLLARSTLAVAVFRGYKSGKIKDVFVAVSDGVYRKTDGELRDFGAHLCLTQARRFNDVWGTTSSENPYTDEAIKRLSLNRFGDDLKDILHDYN